MEAIRRLRHVLVALAAVIIVVTSLPFGIFEQPAAGVRWIGNATGLQQSWRMFSPDVRDHARWLEIETEASDETTLKWRLEDRRMLALGYRGDRWRKLAESAYLGTTARHCLARQMLAEDVLEKSGDDTTFVRLVEASSTRSPSGQTEMGDRNVLLTYEPGSGPVHADATRCAG